MVLRSNSSRGDFPGELMTVTALVFEEREGWRHSSSALEASSASSAAVTTPASFNVDASTCFWTHRSWF